MLFMDLMVPSCRRSFWILFCCLLMTSEFQVYAKIRPHSRRRFKHRHFHHRPGTIQENELVSCPEGQVQDGDHCTCPLPADVACQGDTGGVVCDKFGGRYPSLCHLTVKMCREEISMAHDVSSCGHCPKIRLMNSAVLHLSSMNGLETFSLRKSAEDGTVEYRSDDNSDLRIYFEKKLNRWIIGEKRGQIDMLLAQFVDPSTFVQDSHQGAFVVRQNLTQNQQSDTDSGRPVNFYEIFNFDPHLHLVCVNETVTERLPEVQAFGFLAALIVISVLAAATSTTLAVVQKVKGCLYYPEVCSLRDEIKDKLKPKLQEKTHDFQLKFGSGDSFKNTLKEVRLSVQEVQANIVLINKLLTDIDTNWQQSFTKAETITGLIPTQINDGLADIAQFDEMAKQSVIAESIGLGMAIIDAGLTSAALVAGTMSTAAAVFSAALAVLGIALSAVAIAISAIEERKLRDTLRKSKSDLENSISNVEKAEKTMAEIQNNLLAKLVNPLKNFAERVYAVTKDNMFNDFQKFLTLEFYTKISLVNTVFNMRQSGATKITLDWLTKFLGHIEKIIKYTQEQITRLRDLFAQQEEMLRFLDTIKNQVESFKSPLDIYTGLLNAKIPTLLKGKLSSLPALMHYISKDILSSSPCFMGYDLTSARRCKSCFDQDIICDVPQLSSDKKKIQDLIAQKKPVCLFKQDLKSDAFDSTYKVIKYMASFVLSSHSCYWGYNLAEVRDNHIPKEEINKARISSMVMMTISFFKSQQDTLSSVRSRLCSNLGVCNDAWQDMILCVGNRNYTTGVGISCSGTYNNCQDEIKQFITCPRV